jgi:hypothetical protein
MPIKIRYPVIISMIFQKEITRAKLTLMKLEEGFEVDWA